MSRLIAVYLAAALCLPAAESDKSDIRKRALGLPTGKTVSIKTTGNRTVQGKLTAVTSDGVILRIDAWDYVGSRFVPFTEITSFKPIFRPTIVRHVASFFESLVFCVAILVFRVDLL